MYVPFLTAAPRSWEGVFFLQVRCHPPVELISSPDLEVPALGAFELLSDGTTRKR